MKTKALKTRSYTFRLPPHTVAALEAIRISDGVTVAEQIRRGIDLWMTQKALKAIQVLSKAPKTARRS